MKLLRLLFLLLTSSFFLSPLRADDGYRLWLRYDRIIDEPLRQSYLTALGEVRLALYSDETADTPTLLAAQSELRQGLHDLLGAEVSVVLDRITKPLPFEKADAFDLSSETVDGHRRVSIRGGRAVGILYGAFDLLRRIQTGQSLDQLSVTSAPKIERRLLNHWDDLNRHVERGYAGFSLWEWFYLPEIRTPRYRDYARACASIGINGTVLTNVNASAQVLTAPFLAKVAALADEFRPYGVRVYLTARFSAPIEIGGLKTADPLDPAVAAWWKAKVDEVYRYVPDFGGFLVKANSEGQPGPQDYKRTHADGANMLADAIAPHHGIIMWRAFVYSPDNNDDRVKQAVTEFGPLDGKFRDNVIVQVKNGPLDFMPREPFSPLFGAMPKTRLALELQVTQEYLGQSTQLAYLAPLWKEVLETDTFANGPGSTVARVIDGSLGGTRPPDGFHPTNPNPRATPSVIAGVSNIGTDRNFRSGGFAQLLQGCGEPLQTGPDFV